jgi:hypothetical protein
MTNETKIQRDMSEYAGEAVQIDTTPANIYAFASELGALRIFAKYRANGAVENSKVRVGYSESRGSWYASLAI